MLSNWEQYLNKGDSSPYDGVLVPEDAYRFYQKDVSLFPDCQQRLDAALAERMEPESTFTKTNLLVLLSGVLIGFVASQHIH